MLLDSILLGQNLTQKKAVNLNCGRRIPIEEKKKRGGREDGSPSCRLGRATASKSLLNADVVEKSAGPARLVLANCLEG